LEKKKEHSIVSQADEKKMKSKFCAKLKKIKINTCVDQADA